MQDFCPETFRLFDHARRGTKLYKKMYKKFANLIINGKKETVGLAFVKLRKLAGLN